MLPLFTIVWRLFMADQDSTQYFLDAALEALKQFPLEVEDLRPAAQSENVTFRVRAVGAATDYALRLHRPGYNSLEELESERLWCAALHTSGVRVQKSVRTVDGGHFCSVAIPGEGGSRYAGLTSWLPGQPLTGLLENNPGAETRARVFRTIGRLAAMLHQQSRSWRPPPGFTRCRLDVDGLLGESPRWGRFWEHRMLSASDRELLLATRGRLAAMLQEYGEDSDRFGVIHADLHANNIVIQDDLFGLIDFDDAAFGWFLYDLATALVEEWPWSGYPLARAALLAGYREVQPLSEADEALLDRFILLRGMALIGWFHQRPERDESDFLPPIIERVLAECRAVCAGSD